MASNTTEFNPNDPRQEVAVIYFDGTNWQNVTPTTPLPIGGGSVNTGVSRVSAGFMAPGQTAKQYTGKQALSTGGTTTVTLETVTTGKTFYITDIMISSDVASATQNLDVRLQAAGADIFRQNCHSLLPIDMPGMETQPFASTGQVVTLLLPTLASGTGNVWYFISGFEQ